MSLRVLNRAVVVLAQGHNPTILHPAFLEARGIVSEDWKLAEPPICTPPFSVVKYANGVVFLVESNRLQVLENEPPEDVAASPVPELAAKYVETLPHVRYTAVGVNCAVLAERGSPESAIIERFIKSGPWNEGDLRMKAAGLRFVYEVEGGQFRLNLDPGKVGHAGGEQAPGIVVNANYHTDIPPDSPIEKVEETIRAFPDKCRHLAGAVRSVLGLGD